MKILLINSLYTPNIIGGAERSVQILAESFASCGHEVIVATTASNDKREIINKVKVQYVRVPNLYWMYTSKKQAIWKKPFWHLLDADNPFVEKIISNLINSEMPDIVHTNNLSGFSVRTWREAKKKSVPIVHTLRDCYLLCARSTMFKSGRTCSSQCITCKLCSIPKKNATRQVDAVVGISHYILNEHLSKGYFKDARIKTRIFNSVEKKTEVSHHSKSKRIRIGFVGMLSPEKGIEFLLDRLQKNMPENTVIEIFGKGVTQKYENFLKGRYQSKLICFRGYREQIEIFQNIDILIVPSLCSEAFGRVVPEAFTYNIPVLVSNRGGLPEIIEEGKNGYIFDPDVSGDFGKKLSKIIINRRKLNSFNQELFSVDKIYNEYFELYNQIIRQKAS